MTLLEAALLGIVQGLTEFLPVSSSGHLELGSVLLNVSGEDNLAFAIAVHAATALSTLVVFYKDILAIVKGVFSTKWNEDHSFLLKILISMIPVGIVGLLFEEEIARFFTGNLMLVGFNLLITALLLFLSGIRKNTTGPLTYLKAFGMGIAQTVAILPGISRSGATISSALYMGVDKGQATRFSFLMVLPPIVGANLLSWLKMSEGQSSAIDITFLPVFVGFVSAFLTGYFACRWMINIVKRGRLVYFAIYCTVIGVLSIFFALWAS